MNEKLINSPLTAVEGAGFLPRGALTRTVKIPARLTEEHLIAMAAPEIEALLAVEGKAVGIAAMVKLAAGIGETPPGTQFAAAKFLIERDDLRQEAAQNRAGTAAQLTREALLAIIADLESGGHMLPITQPEDAGG